MQVEVIAMTRDEFESLDYTSLVNIWRDGWLMQEDGDIIYFWRG